MQDIVNKLHSLGPTFCSLWSPKGALLAGDSTFAFHGGEIGHVQRAFKSKTPAIRIGNNNHNIGERKTGKMPVIYGHSAEFGTNVICIDVRKFVIVAQFGEVGDKEKKELHQRVEEYAQSLM